MKKKNILSLLRGKQYVFAGTLILIAAAAMTTIYSNEQAAERLRTEQQIAQSLMEDGQQMEDLAKEEGKEEAQAASSVVKPETKEDNSMYMMNDLEDFELGDIIEDAAGNENGENETDAAETMITPKAVNKEQVLHFTENSAIQWPMEGNVILNYSMDSTVYFATLDQYKCNPGILISGEVNSKVLSVAQGRIASIRKNEVTGTTVTVDLGDGYQAVYGQLKELNFKEGDYVEAGHVIGYLSEPTKYFAVEGSNLYFELQKDGQPIDPIDFFE